MQSLLSRAFGIQVIASDKTGTLTQNLMTVENIWVNGQFKQTVDYTRINQETETVMVAMKDHEQNTYRSARGCGQLHLHACYLPTDAPHWFQQTSLANSYIWQQNPS